VGFPPASPAVRARYQLKLAPPSSHDCRKSVVSHPQAVVGSTIAQLAINIPLHPESMLLIIPANFACHSACTNVFCRIKGDIGVRGSICIPCINSMLVPKYVVWSALFMNRMPVTKLGTKAGGWIVLSGDISMYRFIALRSAIASIRSHLR